MFYKRLIGALVVVLNLCLMSAFAQSDRSNDEEFVRKHQFDVVNISCERIDDYAITRVFLNSIYHLTVSVKEGYGQSPYWGNLVAARVGDELVPLPRPSREGDYAALLPMLRPDLKLTSEDVAETLQRALDLDFPTVSDNKWTEKFRHTGNQWTFERGRSVLSPAWPAQFVLTTNDKGTIVEVKYVRNPSAT